jgi:bifunctional DNA-binding transcriptional regulator/antitoxin component of YhaV-PrlF toxin-antitoxin module
MVKLQKQLAYRYKEKKYYKHLVVIPEETLQRVGWTPGENLEWTVSGNSLVLRPMATSTPEDQTTSTDNGGE